MPLWVSDSAKQAARRVDLYSFLLSRHPNAVEKEGSSLRLCCNHSVSVKKGYSGYRDFATGETGNSVDCLVNYLGYGFLDAVAALCEFGGILTDRQETSQERSRASQRVLVDKVPYRPSEAPQERSRASQRVLVDKVPYGPSETPQERSGASQRGFVLPEPVHSPYRRLFAYLTQIRGIPPSLVQMLVDDGLLYQETSHANMVFVNSTRDFAELRGSNSVRPFHQVMFDPNTPAAFWWFKPSGLDSDARVAYVCEGAIDAISLYLLRAADTTSQAEHGLYCSIGGVANQQRIDAVKAGMTAAGRQTIIAVDNDKAGADCRSRNPDCRVLIPWRKDWNDDLIDYECKYPGVLAWLDEMVIRIRNVGSVL